MNTKLAAVCVLAPVALAGCSRSPAETKTDDPKPAATTAAAQKTPASTPASSPAPPATVTFALSAGGLPEDGMWKCDPVLADVNADGLIDLAAIPRLGEGPRVWLGDGRGGWTESSEGLEPGGKGSCGGGVGVADVNNDTHMDLVVGDHCYGVYVYLGDGAGKWQKVVGEMYPEAVAVRDSVIHHYVGAEDIACGDVNGDGNMDLVVAAADDGGINVFHGDGTGRNWTWSALSPLPTGWSVRVVLADLDGDDRLDIVASHSDGPRVWLNAGADGWNEAREGLPSPMIRGIYMAMATGDVNGDGRVDIVAANWYDGPEVYFQQEDSTWIKSDDVFPAMLGGATGLAVGDLDGDDHLDIAVAGRLTLEKGFSRGVYMLRGDGRGGWTHVVESGLPATGLSASPGVTIGDFNGDGQNDLVACSGLKVATNPKGPPKPTIDSRILPWIASPVGE